MATEKELKYTVHDPAVFAAVAALDTIAGYTARDRGVTVIHDTAFDTPGRLLYNNAMVFRLREYDGRRVLTFKAGGGSDTGFYRREEHEAIVSCSAGDIMAGRLPESPAAVKLRERIGPAPLDISLDTRNNRRIIDLTGEGSVLFELSLDDVTFAGPGGTAHVRELEVESKGGTDRELVRIGRWLSSRFPLHRAGPSKYVLGMQLVGGMKA